MPSALKVAFVGAGYMATEHMRAFASLPDVEIAGICSRTRERAEKLAAPYGARVCDSVSDLYAKTGADLVVVTVVELSMAEIASECFDHPWTVLLEKPAGYDLVDATRIRDAATRARSRAFVALNRRAYSSTRQAIELLRGHSSERFIKVIDQQDQQAAILQNNQPDLVARNFMFANSIHLIDYFRVLARGEVAGIEPIVRWSPQKPGLVLAKVNFASGDIGKIRWRDGASDLEQISAALRQRIRSQRRPWPQRERIAQFGINKFKCAHGDGCVRLRPDETVGWQLPGLQAAMRMDPPG